MFRRDWKVESVDLSLEFFLCSLPCIESFSETKCNNFWQSKPSPMNELTLHLESSVKWHLHRNSFCWCNKERHWHVLIANWMRRKCITTNCFLLIAGTELHHKLTPNLVMGYDIQLCGIMHTKNILIFCCCSGFLNWNLCWEPKGLYSFIAFYSPRFFSMSIANKDVSIRTEL